MFDRLDRAWRCVGAILCACGILLTATAPGATQSLQEIFGFGRTDPGPSPTSDTTAATSPPSAAAPPQSAAPRAAPRASGARGTKAPVRRSSGDAVKDGQSGRLGERINGNTVAIMSDDRNATNAALADDLSAVLDGDDLRILPVIGKGGAQNIRDVRFMKGIDLGITQSNLLTQVNKSDQTGPIDDKIVYLAKLFNEEMHVIVRAGDNVSSLTDLAGKSVNFGEPGSGTQLTARDLFDRLGIKVAEVNLDQAQALLELKSGRIAASVMVSGKPVTAVSMLSAAGGFRLLPVPYPKELQDDYLPATLSPADYPNLVDRPIDTVAVGAVLIAYNWPKDSERYRRLEKFVAAFFPRLADLQTPPRHPKWRETNLAAVLPGWQRLAAADEWLRKNREQAVASTDVNPINSFLTTDDDAAGTRKPDQLFKEFLKWNRERRSP